MFPAGGTHHLSLVFLLCGLFSLGNTWSFITTRKLSSSERVLLLLCAAASRPGLCPSGEIPKANGFFLFFIFFSGGEGSQDYWV